MTQPYQPQPQPGPRRETPGGWIKRNIGLKLSILIAILGLASCGALINAIGGDDLATTAQPTPSLEPTSAPSTPTRKLARVPVVEGLGLVNAKRKLRSAGLEVGDVDRRASSKREDTVLEQRVDKGTQLEPHFHRGAYCRSAVPSGALGGG
jgi:hypothetical protein